jgi:hypothetical protein
MLSAARLALDALWTKSVLASAKSLLKNIIFGEPSVWDNILHPTASISIGWNVSTCSPFAL